MSRNLFLIIAICITAVPVSAQSPRAQPAEESRTILGQIQPECKVDEQGWVVRVSVMKGAAAIAPNPSKSRGKNWSHRVAVGAVVEVGFARANYESAELPAYEVTTDENQNRGVSRMHRIGDCPSETALKPRPYGTAASASEVSSVGERVGERVGSYTRTVSAPTGKALLRNLTEEASRARKFNFKDLFQYNFSVLSATYADNNSLTAVLEKFKADNPDLFEQQSKQSPDLIRKLAEQVTTQKPTLSRDEMNGLLLDDALDSSIRGSAAVSLLALDLNENEREEERKIFRAYMTDTSSDLYLTSVIAMARIGTAEDRNKIREDINSADVERAVAATKAIRAAAYTEGLENFQGSIDELTNAIREKDRDVRIRLAATEALRPFALYLQDSASIEGLKLALSDPKVEVRLAAANALGLGVLERRGDVRQMLNYTIKYDANIDVRNEAKLSLWGKP